MKVPSFDEFFQGASLVVLAVTVYVSYRQARAAEKMARLSLEQTNLSRTQHHASFRPVVEATGLYGPNRVEFKFKNVGISPALRVICICRSGYRQQLGSLAPGQAVNFEFENSFSRSPEFLGPPEQRDKWNAGSQVELLRLEYESITGAKAWTSLDFPLGRQGDVGLETRYGMTLPSLN
jgi:hypothetical protein